MNFKIYRIYYDQTATLKITQSCIKAEKITDWALTYLPILSTIYNQLENIINFIIQSFYESSYRI